MSVVGGYLLLSGAQSAPVAFGRGPEEAKSYSDLARAAAGIAAALAGASDDRALVLCQDRYWFSAALLALLATGRSLILPPSHTSPLLQELKNSSLTLHDGAPEVGPRALDVRGVAPAHQPLGPVSIEPERLVVELFTSGSTGQPVRWQKTARQLLGEARLQTECLDLQPADRFLVTVPPQHIYGLLFGVLAPLMAGASFSRATPSQASELCAALTQGSPISRLVTVPAHLEALSAQIAAGSPKPKSAWPLAISSGARLNERLAGELKAQGISTHEVLGSTETGGIAWRNPALSSSFAPLPGIQVSAENERMRISSPFLEDPSAPYLSQDAVEFLPDGSFRHLGRADDVVKVGGKRTSIAEIESAALELEGVKAARAITRPSAGLRGQEIWLAVVAPGYTSEVLKERLRKCLDAVFVPRRVRFVAELPTDERGKVPRAALSALFEAPAKRQPVRTEVVSLGAEEASARCSVPADCVSFAGHFPTDALLPAVAQLHDIILPMIRRAWPEFTAPRRMIRLKFSSPIRAGQHIDIQLRRKGSKVEYSLKTERAEAASGSLDFSEGAA